MGSSSALPGFGGFGQSASAPSAATPPFGQSASTPAATGMPFGSFGAPTGFGQGGPQSAPAQGFGGFGQSSSVAPGFGTPATPGDACWISTLIVLENTSSCGGIIEEGMLIDWDTSHTGISSVCSVHAQHVHVLIRRCQSLSAGFGQASAPGFGTPAAPGFGSPASPAFGAPASPAAPFGAPASGSAFGGGFAAAAGQSGVAPLHF